MNYKRYGYDEKTGKYTSLPYKEITKTVRLDSETYSIICAMPGKNFSEKLRRLVYQYDCVTNNPESM